MKIIFTTDNASFEDGNLAPEVERILRKIARQVGNNDKWGVITDVNGNRIGSWELSE